MNATHTIKMFASAILIILAFTFLASCSDDPVEPTNEENTFILNSSGDYELTDGSFDASVSNFSLMTTISTSAADPKVTMQILNLKEGDHEIFGQLTTFRMSTGSDNYIAQSGTIKITEDSDTHLKGTFNGITATANQDNGPDKSVTLSGSFNIEK